MMSSVETNDSAGGNEPTDALSPARVNNDPISQQGEVPASICKKYKKQTITVKRSKYYD